MSDPAIEAARRAWDQEHPESSIVGVHYTHSQLAAAREALKPIREWYERVGAAGGGWLDLLPLIYTTEELEQGKR